MTILVLALVFLAALGVTLGTYTVINRRRLAAAAAARQRLRDSDLHRPVKGTVSILKDQSASASPLLERLLGGRSLMDELAEQLVKAGSTQKPGTFLLISVGAAVAGFLVGQRFGGPFLGLVFGLFGFIGPFLNLKRLQTKRFKKFQEQLPDAIDMLVNAMRAGYSFQAAMRFIGEEVPEPLGPEFARFYDEQRLGMEIREALLAMQERVGSLDLKMLVTAILIQRESGGNLSEVLENIAKLMRERVVFRGEVETLTAESKLSARILSILPLAVFTLLFMQSPDVMRPMLTEPMGRIMIGIALSGIISGYYTMMKIATIEM